MQFLPGIIALLTGIAGWFYLFYSRAAQGLASVEDQRLNRRRGQLRRVGGLVMLLLAVCFYLGFYAVDAQKRPRVFVGLWATVMVLLGGVVLLAFVDVRLTLKLRSRRSRSDDLKRLPPS